MFLTRNIGAAQPGPTDDFWYLPMGQMSGSGARVSPATALRVSTVYKCVRVISETLGMLPCITYRRLDNGGKERAATHPLASLLHDTPNPWQTAMQWKEMMQAHATMRGAGYSRIVYNGAGRPDMLVPLHPDRTKVEVVREDRPPRFRYTRADGTEEVLVWGEVLFLAGLSSDGFTPLNPIELERETIGAAMATRDYGARYFANDARFPGWIGFAGKFADEITKRRFRDSFQAAQSGSNSGKVAVLEHGMTYHELGVKNTDAQFMDTRKYQDVDICGLFRVPPHKIGILDQSKWANIEQQALEFVSDCIMPWAVRWEQCLARDLDFGDGYFPEILLDMLLRGDTATRYAAYGKGIQDGWMTRNEARIRENLNPIPGLDTPLQPLNMTPAGSRAADQARGAPPTAEQQLRTERQVLIATAAAERIARKEVAAVQRAFRSEDVAGAIATFFDDHERFVAEVLSVPLTVARDYCQDTAAHLVQLHDTDQIRQTLTADWTTRQVAALLRLGET